MSKPHQGKSRIYVEDQLPDGTWVRRGEGVEIDAPLDRSCVIDVSSPCYGVIRKVLPVPTPAPQRASRPQA